MILLLIYVIVSVAAQAYIGTAALVKNPDDILSFLGTQVFGSPLDKILIIAVLTSAAASTQTTILPTARTTLSMARAGAMPRSLGDVRPRTMTPTSPRPDGAFSIVWYVGLTIVSENILFDSISALGLMIAFYYGLTGYACVDLLPAPALAATSRRSCSSGCAAAGRAMLTGMFIKSCVDLSDPANSASGDSWFGIGPPLIIGIGFLIFGVILMVLWYLTGHRAFFRRKTETAHADALTA